MAETRQKKGSEALFPLFYSFCTTMGPPRSCLGAPKAVSLLYSMKPDTTILQLCRKKTPTLSLSQSPFYPKVKLFFTAYIQRVEGVRTFSLTTHSHFQSLPFEKPAPLPHSFCHQLSNFERQTVRRGLVLFNFHEFFFIHIQPHTHNSFSSSVFKILEFFYRDEVQQWLKVNVVGRQ